MTTTQTPEETGIPAGHEVSATHPEVVAEEQKTWREWMMVATGLVALVAMIAVIVAVAALAGSGNGETKTIVKRTTTKAAASADAAAPTLAQSKGVKFEKYAKVDPTLPAVPAGAVKRFTVGVEQHVAQVSADLAPVQVWTYTVNGKRYPGTAASPPIVVNEGDRVSIDFVNGASKSMGVTMPHSIDFHSAEVAPSKYYVDVAPGKHEKIDFIAKHPGVFMYHCATQPVLMHTGAGMTGMMVVKPRNLPKVDKELWMTQQEFYIGQPGGLADMDKMAAEKPDVIAFNGYANQYKTSPITVRKDERIRMYLLDAGPSKWSAFHVIGTVFDTTHVEGVVGHDSQTVNLAPSQGGWVEFTLDQEGNFPFVTHSFGDMVHGAAGVLHTSRAPMPKAESAPAAAPTGGSSMPGMTMADANVTLGDMWVKSSTTALKAGKLTFAVKNTGATQHGLAIVAAPAKVAGGMVDPTSFLTKGKALDGGASDTVSATLKPGNYELICFMPGHYMAGQKLPFVVK